jgi:hypothetical protein
MQLSGTRIAIAAAASAVMLLSNGPVAATPLSVASANSMLASQAAEASPFAEVQYRYRRYRRYGGGGAAAGFVAGAIIGGIIASQAYPYRTYGPYPYNDAVAYCSRRFRSYDPYSGTYLGYDGFRHPCP